MWVIIRVTAAAAAAAFTVSNELSRMSTRIARRSRSVSVKKCRHDSSVGGSSGIVVIAVIVVVEHFCESSSLLNVLGHQRKGQQFGW